MFWLIAALAVLLWGILGGASPSTGTNGSNPGGGGCQGCNGLTAWWHGLNGAQKVKQAVWYAWKKADCALRGC